jgi:predicted lactoylglutathione lyase
MNSKIFINLPVADLDRAKNFYTTLGFTVNEQFSDEKAACIVISEAIYVMLLTKPFFQTFTSKTIIDASSNVEVLNCLMGDSKEDVDNFLKKSLAGGGSQAREVRDQGFMYDVAVQDPDGHIWEYGWMNMEAFAHQQPQEAAQN